MKTKSPPKRFPTLRLLRAAPCVLLCWICAVNDALAFPPQITAQPTNQTVQLGNNATFVVGATTSAGLLTYQWYFQAGKVAGATNNTYTRTNAQLTHAGTYHVAVTNADGGRLSSNASLTVIVAPWYNPSWYYRKAITISHTNVTANLTNFPVLISRTDSDLQNRALTDGYDLLFTSSDGTSKLAHEIESYTNSNGALVAWVNVPLLSSTVDTTLYLYYGNSASTNQQNAAAVWDANFKAVWHLKENPTNTAPQMKDSTATARHGTTTNMLSGNQQAAQISGGLFFDGTSEYVQTTSSDSKTANDITWELWFKASTTSFGHHLMWQGTNIGNGWGDAAFQQEMHISIGDFLNGSTLQPNYVQFFLGDDVGTNAGFLTVKASFSDTNGWHHVAAVVTSLSTSPAVTLYLDGVAVDSDTGTTARTLRSNWDTDVRLGVSGLLARYFAGRQDEVRISTMARSAAWIATGYKNQNSPGTFASTSSEQANDVATTVAGPASVLATTNFSYTITVTNLGSFTSSNIVVSDNLPAGFNFVSASGGGTLVGGGPGQVVFDGASANNTSGTLTWAHVTTSAANRLMLVGVSIGGTGAVSTITYGGLSLTRVQASEASTIASEVWQLVNPPGGTNTVSITRSGTGTLVAGAATFSGVDQTTPISAVNSARGSSPSPSVTINSATNEIVFDNVAYDKNGDPTPGSGQTELWGITGAESGSASIKPGTNSVTMFWTTPNARWVDIAVSVKSAPQSGVVTWAIPRLTSGAATNFTLTVTAPLTGTLTNTVSSTATTADSNVSNNDGSAAAARVVTTVTPIADLVIMQSGLTSVAPLTNYTCTVTVSNRGPCAASSVVVSDTLAPMLTYVSSSSGGSYMAGVVTWPALASLAKGATANFTVTVRAPISGILTNTAACTSSTVDTNTANNNGSSASAKVITAVSPLQVANTSFGASVQTLNWSHTVSPGSSRILIVGVSIDVTNATVNSATFAGFPTLTLIGQTNSTQTKVLMYRMLNPQVGTFPISINLSTAAGIVGGAVSFNGVNQANPIGAFAATTGSVTNASVTVAGALGGVVIDTIAPKSPRYATNPGSAQTLEWNLSGANYSGAGSSSYGAASVTPSWSLDSATNWAMAAVALNSATILADVTVSATGPASVVATSNLTYSITVTNLGASTASNVVVSHELPAGATFVSASSGGTNNAGVVTWPTLTNFVNGARTNYTVTLQAPAIGTLTNIVYSTAFTADPDPSNNNGTGTGNQVVTTVTPLADGASTVTGPAGAFAAMDFSYAVSVTNAGPSPADNVLVSDTLSAGATFVSATGGGIHNAGVVTWSLASLASGAAATYTVTVTAPASGSLTNTVASTATPTDLVPSNNNGSGAGAQLVTAVYPIPMVSGQRLPGGNFQMELNTIPDSDCSIEASTNLVDWITLITTNPGDGHVIFIDPDTTNYPVRFYRSRQGP